MKKVLWSNLKSTEELIEEHFGDSKNMRFERELEDDVSDEELEEIIHEVNVWELDFLREALNVSTEGEIVVLADMGLWDGRRNGYKLAGYELDNQFYSDTDYIEWSIDRDFEAVAIHHDGRNYYRYREVKPNLSDLQLENFMEALHNGLTDSQITYYTRSLVPTIKKALENY